MSACIPGSLVTMVPAGRGIITPALLSGVSIGAFRIPTDPVGATSVTFEGVIAGSEIRVYLPDGTEIAGIESCAADQVLNWNVYASGNSNNGVTIKIVDIRFKIKVFPYTSRLGVQSIPIQQEVDHWYKNP